MNSTPQFRRAGPIVAALALAVWGCTESPTGPRNGAVPVKPSFAVNASANLDQWANGSPVPTGQSWQNGNLNGNNSQYAEGKAVPFRLALEGLTVGTHFITIQYDFTAGGHKAYDYLASIEATEPTALAQICNQSGPGGRSSLCGPASNTGAMPGSVPTSEFPWPVDNFTVDGLTVSGAQANGAIPRFLRIYGGTISSITTVSHAGCTAATPPNNTCDGNSTGEMLVTFTAAGSAVQLVWSGHLGKSSYWNSNNPPDGAGQVSGAPWHMRTLNLDAGGAANQDRSIQPSALVQPPAVTVSKNADAATVSAGSPIGFTITVNNTGSGDATGFVLNDPLPAGSGINWSIDNQTGPAGVTCAISGNVGSQVLRCPPTAPNTVTFPAGGTLTVRVTSPTTFASCATYNNTATVSLTNGTAPSPAVAQTTVQCPLLQIQKTADASAVSAGSAIGFGITVSNTGQGTATSVTLSDALPGGAGVDWSIDGGTGAAQCSISGSPQTETLTCNFGDLASGASKTVHLTSGTTSESCKAYPNTATAQATNHAQVQAQATTTVNCGAIGITKTADASPVNAGDQIGFTITVTNTGQGNATGVSVTDNLPSNAGLSWSESPDNPDCTISGGQLSCSFGTLAPGASKSVHIVSPTTFASCATIPNTASVTTTNDGSGQATDNVVVQCPDLDIDKLADNASVSAGSPIGFLITVTNSGAGTAKSVTLSDALPGGSGVDWSINGGTGAADCSISGSPQTETLNCSFGDLASGASKTVHLTSPTTFASCATYPNTASAQAANHAQVQDQASTQVLCPSIEINKTADASPVNAGDNIGFLLTVSNTGSGTATGVVLTDVLPTNQGLSWSVDGGSAQGTCSIASGTLTCQIGTLGPGQNATVHLTSPTTAASCGTVNNTGSVTSANDGSDQDDASIVVRCPDLSVQKTASNGTISAGDVASFTITVTNNGQGLAKNVTLNDPLPAGLSWSENPDNPQCSINSGTLECSFGDLASGASKSVTVEATTAAANCGTLHNVAVTAATNEPGSLLEDNTDDADIVVNCGAIDLTKVADATTVSAGDQIGFTLTVTNTGQGNATNVHLTDLLPANAGLSWSESPDNPDCTISSGTLDCNFGTLAPGASKSVHIVSPTTAASCGTVNNTGNVTTGNDGSDQASASVTVNCGAIDLTKVADQGTVSAGTTIGYTLTVTNTGAGNATNVQLTDVLPANAGLSWSESPDNPDCTISGGQLSCSFGTLAPGASKSVHISSPTTAASCGTVNNTGNVTTGNDGSDEASASITVNCPNIDLTKTADAASVNAGANIGFTLTVSNSGPGNATGVVLTDVLPTNAGLSWSVNGGTAAGTCSIASGTLTCNIGALAAGASATVHLTSPTTTASCGTVNNTGNVTTTNDGSDQASASVTVNCPVGGQIAPTATTCSDFNAGIAADLTEVLAGLKAGKINNVAPGVFFYYTKFQSPGGSFTVNITQSNNGPANWPNFDFKQDQVVLYSANCTKLTANVTTDGGQAHVTINAAAGTTFIIGVKYETATVVGQNATPQGPLPITYTYQTSIGATVLNNTDTVVLRRK